MEKEILPQDTEDKIYIEDFCIDTVMDLFLKVIEKWGPKVDILNLKIEHEHIQVKCFHYDQYDSGDYRNYFVITKVN
jgi:hypothetical protein